jgi:HEAT repeat protein
MRHSFPPLFLLFLFNVLAAFADTGTDKEAQARLDTVHYGTETEIVALIQTLKGDATYADDKLDAELVAVAQKTKNQRMLIGILSFFGGRGKQELESRALAILENRDAETSDTVLAAIDYFGKIKSSQSVPLLESIIDAGTSTFTGPAIRALGHSVSGGSAPTMADEVAEYLIDLYTNRDPGAGNNSTLINALGETASKAAVPFLTGIVRDSDTSASLRIAALDALAQIGDNAGLDAILGAVAATEPSVRTAAVGALGPFSGAQVDDAIIENFRDSFFRTRAAAAKAAGERKLAAAIPYLKYRAEKDEALSVKEESVRALGSIATREAVEVLRGLFAEQKNPERIRILAAEMLMKTDADASTETIITALDDAQKKRQTALYNGLLRVLSAATSPKLEPLARRFFASGTALEKSCALDITLNNKLTSLRDDVRALTDPKNGNLASKAQRVLEGL